MLRFLADENFPIASVRLLRSGGLDVFAVVEDSPAAPDVQIMERAAANDLVILTFDRDYGELIYRRLLPPPSAVVYFRFEPANSKEPAEYLQRLLSLDQLTIRGNFTVVDRNQVRQRPLPTNRVG